MSLQVCAGCQHHFSSTVRVPAPVHPQRWGLGNTRGVRGSTPVSLIPVLLSLLSQGEVSPSQGPGCCSRSVWAVLQAGGIPAGFARILPPWFCLSTFGRERVAGKPFANSVTNIHPIK